MIARKSAQRTLSPGLLVSLFFGCLVAVFILTPSHRTLLERQIADGKIDQALATLRLMPQKDKDANPAHYTLIELQLLRKKLNPKNESDVALRFASACEACERYGYKPAFIGEVTQLSPFFPKTATAHAMMASLLSKAPPAARKTLYQALTAQALGENAPDLAARIFDEFWRKAPRNELETEKLVQLWRQAGQPLKSLEVLEIFHQSQGNPLAGTYYRLDRLNIEALRETSQASRAFDAVRILLDRAPASAHEELFRLMVATAMESNRLPQILPELLSRSMERPSDVETLQWIGQGALSIQDQDLAIRTYERLAALRPSEGSFFFTLGQLYEWRNQVPKAFDLHMKALSLGEPKSIPRLLALVRGLYREGELAELLSAHLELVNRLGLEFEFARLQGRTGNFDLAVKGYDEQLQRHPPTVELLKEYGQFLADLYEYEKAMDIYKKAERLDPNDFSLKRAVAELKFRLGDYVGAFDDYENLLSEDSNSETIENFLVLAQSLSKPDKIVAGLQQKLAHSTNVTAQVYRQLAYYQNAIGLPLQARDAFKKGLERFPEDKMLRLQAAHYYADAGDYPHATEILRSHPELKTNPQIAQFHLSLLLLSQRYPEAEHFIRSDISPELSASPSMLEAQATICEAGNRLDEAAAIYARLMALDRGNARYLANCARLLGSLGQSKKALAMIQPHLKDAPPEICHLLAQVFSASGDFKSAEVYERRYLASHPANQPEAWGFLGDILLSKGQKTQARRAYRTGLSVLLGEIQSGHK